MTKLQDDIQDYLTYGHPHSDEYHQAVLEVFDDIASVYEKEPAYRQWRIAERILEPDRVIRFRVCWEGLNYTNQQPANRYRDVKTT